MASHRSRKRLAGAVVSTALVLLIIGGWFAYPYFSFRERFRRSKPALEAYAARVREAGSAAINAPPRRLGYFDVLKMEPLPHGFVFESDYGNPFDWLGIAYSTEPLPEYEYNAAGDVKQIFEPIEGNWYTVFRQ
jgi:hypothetical protein